VVVVDPAGTVIEVNPAAELLLGQPRAGRAWRDVAGIELNGSRHTTLTAPDGTCLDIRVVEMQSPDDGRRAGWVVVARDVTELERLRAELTEQVTRDHLTGLHNRRHLTTVLDEAVGAGGDLAVVMLDVDHFKSVNDRFGHAVGDRLLIALGTEITRAAGPGATVARYGGEEFVVVLPGADGPAAVACAERLRRRCADLTLGTDQGPLCPTISAGVAWLAPGQAADDLLRAADQALYAAKAAGRNRVTAAQPVVV
jgi:diguanylate cyclase (GGDEF)-like protein